MSHGHTIDCTCEQCITARNEASCGDGCSSREKKHTTHEHSEDEDCHAPGDDCCGCGHEHTGAFKKYPLRLICGIAVFAVAMIISNAIALPQWGELALFGAAYIILGANVLAAAAKNIARGKIFDENFLMTVATIGAFVLGDYAEGAAVMLFYLIGETLSDLAVEKSRRSITELMDLRPDYANIERGGAIERVSPESLAIGDMIVIRPGEKVPLDSVLTEGTSTLDTSSLTGESLPRDVAAGSEILAGCINGAGLIKARVLRGYAQSTAAKVLDIVENASSRKAETEKFITKFARYYTPIVCAAALAVAVIPSLITGEWNVWIYRALLFLVISCPCALVVAIPLSYFGGIGGAGKNGILVKGANYMEALTNITEVVFDKTGTLTKGAFEVTELSPQPGTSGDQLLFTAAIAESGSSHPIAISILKKYGRPVDGTAITGYEDIAGYGVKAEYCGKTILAGSARLMEREAISFTRADAAGTLLYIAEDGKYMGYILIADSLKADAAAAIASLRNMNIKTAMLTGDNRAIAQAIAEKAGVDDVKSELLPQDKVSALEEICAAQKGVAFVGDGINDAPVLARADVGIAMGGLGSDAAIEAADVVLMTDQPSKAPLAISIAKKTKRIVWQNIAFALAVKSIFMVLGVTGLVDMWAAVFADVGVTLLAVLNALRALKAPRAD